MEASVILNRIKDSLYNRFFTDVIVSDNDRKMRDVPNHPSKVARGQALKSSKRKIHAEILEASFLIDPSHSVKVVSKHIFSKVSDGKAQRCGCTKANSF